MTQQNQLSTFLVLPEFFTPSNYEPGGREFDNSGTEIQKASLVTPSWTNSLREFGPGRSEGLPAVAGNNLSGRAILK